MALHKDFPKSPHAVLDPAIRWIPADKSLQEKECQISISPLVAKLRKEVASWRTSGYKGVSQTSYSLLRWWFQEEHAMRTSSEISNFRYYFAQQEAVETVIYLYEVAKVKDKYGLLQYDSSRMLSEEMFDEDWLRFVIKMATGSGKTKVMSLLVAWSYFHKLYEANSNLSCNFLLITPNIIVLERIKMDFEGLKIFQTDPILPSDGFEGKNWKADFQMTVHIQDNIHHISKEGNVFLTNIHRIYSSHDNDPSFNDENTENYFLGTKALTSASKMDLINIVRGLDDIMIINDEAHHIHDKKLAWFASIQDISNKMKIKGKSLSLQIDVTATPKHNNGTMFVQTISDYPLVEAIHQNVVKHPVIPDAPSRAKLQTYKSSRFTEKYKDYIRLGYLEWEKAYKEHEKLDKKAVLFIMTDDTKNCDDVAEYLENTYPELKNATLVIHTKKDGAISESLSGKEGKELDLLRRRSNEIDNLDSPYKAIVSVLMLKEGWDTKNVTTIVGLRAYSSKSNILPEQTLGRGLRRMYDNHDAEEYVSVVGTKAFMDFVETIKNEGVGLETRAMGEGTPPITPLVIEIELENMNKNIDKLDIQIPILSPRIYRKYKNISQLDIKKFSHKKMGVKEFSEIEKKNIVFHDVASGKKDHETDLDCIFIPSHQSMLGYFSQTIHKELCLVTGYDALYGKVKRFVINYLFDEKVDIDDLNTLRNLSEPEVTKTIIETFKKEIDKITIFDKGAPKIQNYIKISESRPFMAQNQKFIIPKKSLFNKIIGDSNFELGFASFLEGCNDIISYVKNYLAVGFNVEYKDTRGDIRSYHPDFLVKASQNKIYIVETKGREDLDDIEKIERLYQWCDDINDTQNEVKFTVLYVKQKEYEKYPPSNFQELINILSV